MISAQSGSFRLFRIAGIQVYLHWLWFIWGYFQITTRSRAYSSIGWNIAEYLALFFIVLLHEFGHAFACRQTGGEAKEIVLWPLGGIAFVKPPPRAGAELWSIAAGPLVNVVLYPVLMGAAILSSAMGWTERVPDLGKFLFMVWWINKALLIFNLLPVYPLDGGQILRSLLWLGLGRARSLQIASVLGFVGIAVLAAYAHLQMNLSWIWIVFMGLFLGQQCLIGLRHSRTLFVLQRMPRHAGFACPTCRERPPGGPIWPCGNCGNRFDMFSTRAVCPHCHAVQSSVACVHCGTSHSIERWETARRRSPGEPPIIDV